VHRSDDFEASVIFAKVAGKIARCFQMPVGMEGEDGFEERLNEALAPIHIWTSTIPEGTAITLAMVDVPMNIIEHALDALAPLGVPRSVPVRSCRVLAAVGLRPICHSDSEITSESWSATHASSDVAYASMIVPEF